MIFLNSEFSDRPNSEKALVYGSKRKAYPVKLYNSKVGNAFLWKIRQANLI